MLREQNLSSTFPNMRFRNIWPFCGLFGLYGLEGQTKEGDAISGWAGWALAHQEFGRSVNPIPTRGEDYAHLITACPAGFENLMASLDRVKGWGKTNSPAWLLPPPWPPPSHLSLLSTQQFLSWSKQQEDPGGLAQHEFPFTNAWHWQEMFWTRRAKIPTKSMIFIFLTC